MKRFELEEIGNNVTFDPITICDSTPFTQASFYGNWQRSLGRKTRRFLVKDGGEVVSYFQIVKYPLLLGKSYLYVPYGPVVKKVSEEFLADFRKKIRDIAKEEGAVFVRLDFTPQVPGETLSKFFAKAPLNTYHSAYFQPRIEWFLGLDKSEDELIDAMHKNTRYSIRLAEKREIKTEIVTESFEKYFEDFYGLMTETAKRNGFSLHPKEYYKGIFENLHKSNAYLSVARYGEKILVIDLVIVFGKIANNIFGGSSSDEKTRMPSYLAQWEAIRYAKKLNCNYYNFGGISTEDKTYKGWEGLTFFKKKFGGEEIRHSDFFDMVVNPLFYSLYKLRKLIRKVV